MIGYGKRLLLIHDPETTQLPLDAILEQEGFVVVQVPDGVQALCEMQFHHFDAIIIDSPIPDLHGLDLLKQSPTTWPERPIILFTEVAWDTYDVAQALGAFAWVRKSSDPSILLGMLSLAMIQRVERESVRA
ncbi:MAG: response regulator [Nitrospira sp. LK70]|nr:response regulator [Nitrospira sp. LK70]